jgi:F5/8 type C domain/Bacterial Ig-like domain (group 3)
MSNARRNGWHWRVAGAAAITTTALTVAAFVAPSGQAAFAAGTTTTSSTTTTTTTSTTSTTKATDYNCSASVDETALSRSGWAASANSPSGSNPPSYALDGNLSTRFSTNEDQVAGLYFEVDLGASQSFGELQMEVPSSASDYARSYTVEDSENGVSWSAVASCAGASDAEVVSFPVQTARFVRVVLIGGADWWWSIDEFHLYGAINCSASVEGAALSRSSWTASTNAPLSDSDPPSYALDGNPGTRFSTNKDQVAGLYYELNMRSAFNFDEVDLATQDSPHDYARSYTVEVWTGSVWSSVAICTGSSAVEVVSFPRQTAQYIKVVVGSSADDWWSIDELNVYSSFSEPVTTTTTTAPSRTTVAVSSSANPGSIGTSVTYGASISPKPTSGNVTFEDNGAPISGCTNVAVSSGQATCTTTYYSAGTFVIRAFYSGSGTYLSSSSEAYSQTINLPGDGYWLATANGQIYGNGAAQSFGNVATSAVTGPVVGIAATPTTKGYWVVTANGMVSAFGDAQFYGDLPDLGKHVKDIVAIAPTSNGKGYYLVGADGGFFTFGDAKFAGSLPGIHVHVRDVVGMVATPSGAGYLLVGADGGVFSFGQSHFYGSLPGIHKKVHDIQAILPSSAGTGYILVGADGGAFNFGTGVRFYGSLPGEGVRVDNIVGIALTPDNAGYYMAGSDGHVYTFGDAQAAPQPAGLTSNLPVAAIAGT